MFKPEDSIAQRKESRENWARRCYNLLPVLMFSRLRERMLNPGTCWWAITMWGRNERLIHSARQGISPGQTGSGGAYPTRCREPAQGPCGGCSQWLCVSWQKRSFLMRLAAGQVSGTSRPASAGSWANFHPERESQRPGAADGRPVSGSDGASEDPLRRSFASRA